MFTFSLLAICLHLCKAQGNGRRGHVANTTTENRVLTLYHDKPVSWNHAVEICRTAGSELIMLDTRDALMAIHNFSEWDSWGGRMDLDYWTGLHSSDDGWYYWSDCQPLNNPDVHLHSGQSTQRCFKGFNDVSKTFYEGRNCSSAESYALCEKKEGQCRFLKFKDTTVTWIYPNATTGSINNIRHCIRLCFEYVGELECWATQFYTNVSSCMFYKGNSQRAVLGALQNVDDSITPVYVKFCFEARLNGTSLGDKYTDPSNDIPWIVNCTKDSEQNTLLSESSSAESTTLNPMMSQMSPKFKTSTPESLKSTNTRNTTTAKTVEYSSEAMVTIATDVEVLTTNSELLTTENPESTFSNDEEEWCDCPCDDVPVLTANEKKAFIDNLVSQLSLNKSDISSNQRKLHSADDPRPSAKSVGVVGVVLLSSVFGFLILLDFQGVLEYLTRLKYKRFEAQSKTSKT